jgi:hypothetical protein
MVVDMEKWTLVHLACMLLSIAWNASWIMVSTAKMRPVRRGVKKIIFPVFRVGRIAMFPILALTVISSAMTGDTWEWMIPPIFAINLYLSYALTSREDCHV